MQMEELFGEKLLTEWPGREADRSPASSAKVMNSWSYTSIPQHVFMA
jgi:hypothetical protein